MGRRVKAIRTTKDLVLHDKNANVGTAKGREMLDISLTEFGMGRSIVADRMGRIIAGNKTFEAAQKAGRSKVVTVRTAGDALIVHQREDLDLERDPKALGLAVADNRVAEVDLKWNYATITDYADLGVDLKPFFTDRELGIEGKRENPEPKLEKAAELQKKYGTARGQIWRVGPHRIACGDATVMADVERLMEKKRAAMAFTDPPWNVGIGQDSNPAHRQREGLENDDMTTEEYAAFIAAFAQNLAAIVRGDVYCVLASQEWPNIDRAIRAAGFHWSATLIWVKDSFVMGRSKYQRRYEPIWYGWNARGKSSFDGGRAQDDVWEFTRPKASEEHPTMKPVELVERAIENSSKIGEAVVDLFVGGGSTAVAAHNQRRRAYGMDKDPKYVAVTLERLADMGLKPEREA
jgi:DNA modification methylase